LNPFSYAELIRDRVRLIVAALIDQGFLHFQKNSLRVRLLLVSLERTLKILELVDKFGILWSGDPEQEGRKITSIPLEIQAKREGFSEDLPKKRGFVQKEGS
jgi:hypothetical protein